MTTTKTEYAIRDYASGQAIGAVRLSEEEFAEYSDAAQQPEGLIAAAKLLDLFPVATMSEPFDSDTTVYLD